MLLAVAELLLEVVIGLASDKPTYRFEKLDHNYTIFKCLFLFMMGAGIGGLWLWANPVLSLHSPWLRLVNLAAAPLLSGYGGQTLARFYKERGREEVVPWRHFWYSFSACLGVVLCRYAFGHS